MDQLILLAEPRTVVGKKVAGLRRNGLVPGVVYGPEVKGTIQVSVERKPFEKFYMTHGHSTLFTLRWDGGEEQVVIREVQLEPVRHAPLHIDFFAPSLRKELTAFIPVVLHHHNRNAGGVLTHGLTEIEVRGLPSALPHQIDADISGLVAGGDALRVGDLRLPTGITAVTDADEVIAALSAERVAEPAETAPIETAEPAADAVARGNE